MLRDGILQIPIDFSHDSIALFEDFLSLSAEFLVRLRHTSPKPVSFSE